MNEKLPFVETETNRNLAQAARAQSRKWCKRATTLGSRDIWRRRVRVMMLHFLGSGVVCMACVYVTPPLSLLLLPLLPPPLLLLSLLLPLLLLLTKSLTLLLSGTWL